MSGSEADRCRSALQLLLRRVHAPTDTAFDALPLTKFARDANCSLSPSEPKYAMISRRSIPVADEMTLFAFCLRLTSRSRAIASTRIDWRIHAGREGNEADSAPDGFYDRGRLPAPPHALPCLQKQEDLIATSARACARSRRCLTRLASPSRPRRVRHSWYPRRLQTLSGW